MPLTRRDALDFLRCRRGIGLCAIPPRALALRIPADGDQVSEVERSGWIPCMGGEPGFVLTSNGAGREPGEPVDPAVDPQGDGVLGGALGLGQCVRDHCRLLPGDGVESPGLEIVGRRDAERSEEFDVDWCSS